MSDGPVNTTIVTLIVEGNKSDNERLYKALFKMQDALMAYGSVDLHVKTTLHKGKKKS